MRHTRTERLASRGGDRRALPSAVSPATELHGLHAGLRTARLRLLRLLLKANFDPGQPRLPRGQAGGGRWTKENEGEPRLAQAGPTNRRTDTSRRYLVDLRDHEGRDCTHTIARHVGKSDSYLLTRMQTENIQGLLFSLRLRRAGTFFNLEAANKLVSSTLAKNRNIVDQVIASKMQSEFVTEKFSSQTGHEFYREDQSSFQIFPSDTIRHRSLYGVGVLIRHDPTMLSGFAIVTAYPRTDD